METAWPLIITAAIVILFLYWVVSRIVKHPLETPWEQQRQVRTAEVDTDDPASDVAYDAAPGVVYEQPDGPTERTFRNTFAIMTEERRASLVAYYMSKHQCSRFEAMRRAVEERKRDDDRWSN